MVKLTCREHSERSSVGQARPGRQGMGAAAQGAPKSPTRPDGAAPLASLASCGRRGSGDLGAGPAGASCVLERCGAVRRGRARGSAPHHLGKRLMVQAGERRENERPEPLSGERMDLNVDLINSSFLFWILRNLLVDHGCPAPGLCRLCRSVAALTRPVCRSERTRSCPRAAREARRRCETPTSPSAQPPGRGGSAAQPTAAVVPGRPGRFGRPGAAGGARRHPAWGSSSALVHWWAWAVARAAAGCCAPFGVVCVLPC